MSDEVKVLREVAFYEFGPTLYPPHSSWTISVTITEDDTEAEE